jgi:hypothetical protein
VKPAVVALAICACGSDPATPIDAAGEPDAPIDASTRVLLSQQGLYADIATETLAPGVVEFRPLFELWSDGAVKTRWILFPDGASVADSIDTTDMDRWRFPVGTKVFKQFVVGTTRIETRMLHHFAEGDDENAWFMGSFLWNADGTDAEYVEEGAKNALGTMHDVPRAVKCWDCHTGEPGRVLGFSAIQLSHAGPGPTTMDLAGASFAMPGDATTAAAYGYLHANCGTCHNPLGPGINDVDLILRLDVIESGAADPLTAHIHTTSANAALTRWLVPPYTERMVPGEPTMSAIVARMATRGPSSLDQMPPPLATEVVDDDGIAAVTAWIESLAP